jgi:flagellar biosynthesis anti-sigma factor FlgM
MSVEINGLNNPHTLGVGDGTGVPQTQNTTSDTRGQDTQPSGTVGDQVSLTHAAQQLQQLEGHLKNVPVVDVQRVGDTKAALEQGNYVMHAGNIAQKLAQFESYMPDR